MKPKEFEGLPVPPGSVELLGRFADGDDSALGRLVEKEGQMLLPYIQARIPRYLQRRVGASDILQHTAIDLIAVRDRFENQGVRAFRGMLRAMADLAIAKAVERERAQKRDLARERPPGPSAEDSDVDPVARVAADQTTPSGVVQREERSEALGRVFMALAEDDRRIIELIDYAELPYEKAGEILGITEVAARKRHSRAVAKLRELMKKME